MYLYFDVNGNLKEIVQIPVREGSNRVNTLYIYVEGEAEDGIYKLPSRWTNGKINFALLDSDINLNPSGSYALTKLTGDNTVQLPYNRNRDLKFFKYGFKYEMWSFTLVSPITAVTGVVSATAYLWEDDDDDDVMDTGEAQLALNTFAFNVEASVGIVLDSTITQSQYSYLYNRVVGETVPYIGAVNNVNLGDHNLTAANLFAREDISHYIKIAPDGIRKGTVIGLQSRTYDYTLPNSSGELTTIEVVDWNYVAKIPASDNTANIGSGEYNYAKIYASGLEAKHDITIEATDDHDINLISTYINIQTSTDRIARLMSDEISANTTRTFSFPDADGILATREWVSGHALVYDTDYDAYVIYSGDGAAGLEISDPDVTYRYDTGGLVIIDKTGEEDVRTRVYFRQKTGGGTEFVAYESKLPSKNVIGTFNTSSFSRPDETNYVLNNIPLSGFIAGSDLLIITWDNCFAICPIPQSGPGRVCAAMWNSSGEARTIRIRYELKDSNTKLDIALQSGFTPPTNHTAYVICYKLIAQ